MRYLLVLITFLMTPMISAESIGNVEYTLPQGWKKVNELNSCKTTQSRTLIYVPEKYTREDSLEFFSVHSNDLPSLALNQSSIEKMLQIQFPNKQVYAKILENSPDSLVYEWAVKDGNHESLKGLTRIFTPHEGVRILSYQTEQASQFDTMNDTWMPILKGAHTIP